jgi:hypothetical protein
MLKLKDHIQKHNMESAAHDRAAGAHVNWKNVPVWLGYAEPRDQREGMSSNDGLGWMRWRESVDRSRSSRAHSEPGYAASSADTYESDALAYSLRHQLWEGESAADSLNPDFVLRNQSRAPASNSTGALDFRWLLVAACVLAASALAFSADLVRLVYNRLQAKSMVAAIRVAATWLVTEIPSPTTMPTLALTPTRRATAARTALPSRVPPTLPSRFLVPTISLCNFGVGQRGCHHSGGTYIGGTQ